MPFKLLGCPEASIEAHKTVIYDNLVEYDLFMWLLRPPWKCFLDKLFL